MWTDRDLPAFSVKSGHLADSVVESMPMRLRHVIDLMQILIHAACGDLMQKRFP